MTYRREEGTFESVLMFALHNLPPAKIEAATSKTIDALSKASNPLHKTRLCALDMAHLDRLLSEAGFGRPFFEVYRRISGMDELGLGSADTAVLQTGGLAAAQRAGEVAGTILSVVADGRIEPDEKEALRKAAHAHAAEAHRVVEIVEALPVEPRIRAVSS